MTGYSQLDGSTIKRFMGQFVPFLPGFICRHEDPLAGTISRAKRLVVMMISSNRAIYKITRPFALAAMLLSVAPVLAGCYDALSHPIQQFSSTGESVVYQSGDVAVASQNQFVAAPKSDLL